MSVSEPTPEADRPAGVPAPKATQVVDYEPHFDRSGTTRRVLGHVTDEDHVGRGPRNTEERLGQELVEDFHTRISEAGQVVEHLRKLVDAGLLRKREDGSFEVTEAGKTELAN